jgi:acyl carrier protein
MKEATNIIRNFIIDNFLFGEDDGFSDDASLLDEGIIDSTGVLELVTFLENTFSISIDDEELVPENLDSIKNASKFVDKKKGQQAA